MSLWSGADIREISLIDGQVGWGRYTALVNYKTVSLQHCYWEPCNQTTAQEDSAVSLWSRADTREISLIDGQVGCGRYTGLVNYKTVSL